jgi:hypothetical protein
MAPMPARVTVARADGVMQTLEVPVETWIAGARSVTLRVGPGARVTRVELDADRAFPDVDRANDAWQAGQRR